MFIDVKTISNNCEQQLFHICTIHSFICLKIRTPVDDSGPLSYFVGINVTKICILLGSKLKTSRKFFRFYLSALESAGFSSVQSSLPRLSCYVNKAILFILQSCCGGPSHLQNGINKCNRDETCLTTRNTQRPE